MSDLRYHPVLSDLDEVLTQHAPTRLLIVGGSVPRHIDDIREIRVLRDATSPGSPAVPSLPRGIFTFVANPERDLLIVNGSPGAPSGAPAIAGWNAPDDNPLILIYGWFKALWERAEPVPAPEFRLQAVVSTIPDGQPATVLERKWVAKKWQYRVLIDGDARWVGRESLQEPVDAGTPGEWIRRPLSERDRFAATLTRAKLREHLTDTVYAFRATRTLFRPYQFLPIIKMMEAGAMRLFIADEVGLGKTIEAGLVWTELEARGQADRVLVVCPSTLQQKWCNEMRERFDFELDPLDRRGLDRFLADLERDRLPRRFRGICTLERMRSWSGLERLADLAPRFDLVIVDEAHYMRNAGNLANALGNLLSDWADAMILMSATPLNLGNDDLFNLLQILDPGEFDDRLVLEQRLAPNAVLHRLLVTLHDAKTTNADRLAILQEVRDIHSGGAASPITSDSASAHTFGELVAARPEYRDLVALLSGPELDPVERAMAKRLIARLHALSSVVTRTRKVDVQETKPVREAINPAVDWTDDEAAFYVAFRDWQIQRCRRNGQPIGFAAQMPLRLAGSCLRAAADRVLSRSFATGSWLDLDEEDLELDLEFAEIDDPNTPSAELVELARRIGDTDTKFDVMVQQLRTIVAEGRRVLLFTFSRPTLDYLQRRLADEFRVGALHGGITPATRHEVMTAFRNHEYDVVLATRVASEGLDFEFCSAVVNWDLPWNPMEVEQRIGRIDRIGQEEERILIFNFVARGTIEQDILDRVHNRIGVFQDSIGVLEPIVASVHKALEEIVVDFSLSPEERADRLDQQITAIKEQELLVDDLETARNFLVSTDQADIAGLEHDLLASGRYVGQEELVLLLRDWVAGAPGAKCTVPEHGKRVTVVGAERLAAQVRDLHTAGERSERELDRLARQLRDGMEVTVCLDPNLARVTGEDLLSANHALVRAAVRVPGSHEERFGHLRAPIPDEVAGAVEPGTYLVLLGTARWTGVVASHELWAQSVDIETGRIAPAQVGGALLAALAESRFSEPVGPLPSELEYFVDVVENALLERRTVEQERRLEANALLLDTRKVSIEASHRRKVANIQKQIAGAESAGHTQILRLFEAQLANQGRKLEEKLAELDARRNGVIEVQPVAVCVVELHR